MFGQRNNIGNNWKSETKHHEWYPLLYLFLKCTIFAQPKFDCGVDIVSEFPIDTSISFVGYNFICYVNVIVYNIKILGPE